MVQDFAMFREWVSDRIRDALAPVHSRLDEADATRIVLTERLAALETGVTLTDSEPDTETETEPATETETEPATETETESDTETETEDETEVPPAVERAADDITDDIEETADEIAPDRSHFLTRPLIRRE